jgi:hypothetical protein
MSEALAVDYRPETYNGLTEYDIPYRGMTPGIMFSGGKHHTVLSWTTEDGLHQKTIDTFAGWSR